MRLSLVAHAATALNICASRAYSRLSCRCACASCAAHASSPAAADTLVTHTLSEKRTLAAPRRAPRARRASQSEPEQLLSDELDSDRSERDAGEEEEVGDGDDDDGLSRASSADALPWRRTRRRLSCALARPSCMLEGPSRSPSAARCCGCGGCGGCGGCCAPLSPSARAGPTEKRRRSARRTAATLNPIARARRAAAPPTRPARRPCAAAFPAALPRCHSPVPASLGAPRRCRAAPGTVNLCQGSAESALAAQRPPPLPVLGKESCSPRSLPRCPAQCHGPSQRCFGWLSAAQAPAPSSSSSNRTTGLKLPPPGEQLPRAEVSDSSEAASGLRLFCLA